MRNQLIGLCFLVSGAFVGCSGNEPPSAKECEDVREHVVELSLAHVKPTTPQMKAELAKHRETLHASLGEDFINRCRKSGDEYAECTLAAKTTRDLSKCAAEVTQ